jgi:hypothetical protein
MKAVTKKTADDPLLTASEYARKKGATRQAVSRMVGRHGIRLDTERRAKLSVWLAADEIGRMQDKNTLAARAAGLPEGGVAAIGAKKKIRKMDLEIAMAEIELAKLRGEMIDRKEAERQMMDTVTLCLTLIDQVADNWAAEVRDHAAYEKLTAGIDRARAQVAERMVEA